MTSEIFYLIAIVVNKEPSEPSEIFWIFLKTSKTSRKCLKLSNNRDEIVKHTPGKTEKFGKNSGEILGKNIAVSREFYGREIPTANPTHNVRMYLRFEVNRWIVCFLQKNLS